MTHDIRQIKEAIPRLNSWPFTGTIIAVCSTPDIRDCPQIIVETQEWAWEIPGLMQCA